MWQSRVDNEHYSVSMKIAFSASIDALGHCLHSSRLLSLLRMWAMSYGPWNTAHFGIAAYCNYCRISKNRDKERFACLEDYLSKGAHRNIKIGKYNTDRVRSARKKLSHAYFIHRPRPLLTSRWVARAMRTVRLSFSSEIFGVKMLPKA